MPGWKTLAITSLLIIVFITMIAGCIQDKTDNAPAATRNNTTFENITGIDDNNYNDSDGLSSSQKFAAISIAMKSETVKSYIDSFGSLRNKTIKPVTLMNATTLPTLKTTFFEEGFLNVPALIVTVPVVMGEAPAVQFYNVFVDLTHDQVLGDEKYYLKAQPVVNVIIPPGAAWYHQMTGVGTQMPGDYTSVRFRVIVVTDDMTALFPVFLGKDEFENFKKGLSYQPFKWTDAVTNDKRIIDGSKALEPQSTNNGTATGMFSMNLSHASPLDTKYFSPTYYYVVIRNKANRSIPVNFYVTIF